MSRPTDAALDQLHDDFVEAFRSKDLEALGAFYTEDAVLLPPATTVVSGRAAIVAYWQNAERIQDLVFEATSIKMLDKAVLREAGNLLVASRGQGGNTFNTAAKYVSIWLQVNGAWKLDSTIWNGAGPQPGVGRRPGRGGRGRGGAEPPVEAADQGGGGAEP